MNKIIIVLAILLVGGLVFYFSLDKEVDTPVEVDTLEEEIEELEMEDLDTEFQEIEEELNELDEALLEM
jgi:hypothetical protein